MRRAMVCFAVCLAIVAVGVLRGEPAPQEAVQGGKPTQVALVDVSKIFKNYKRFEKQMEELKQDVEQAEVAYKSQKKELTTRKEKVKELGEAEAKTENQEIERLQAAFDQAVAETKKDFGTRESDIYYNAYQKVSAVVERYAREHGISLVLRFSAEAADPSNREAVLREINKPILFHDGLDITPAILKLLGSEETKKDA